MKLTLIKYNGGRDKRFFELSSGKRPWGILLVLSKGSFELELPTLGIKRIFGSGEVAYVPPYTEFFRRVLEPIDFHQLSFHADPGDAACLALRPGAVNIPHEQVMAWLKSADRIAALGKNSLFLHMLERMITENYIFTAPENPPTPRLSRALEEALEYINENLAEKIDVEAVARRVGLSYTGLIFKFRNELGMTPTEYIMMHRIKLAKRLLCESDMPVAQVGEACGYANAYYFSNAFLKSVGYRPSEYRKKMGTE